MRKILLSIFLVLSAILLINIIPQKNAYAGVFEEDQYCDNDAIQNVDGYWKILSHTSLSQTFTPTKNHLTKVQLAIAGGADINAPIKMDIYMVGGGLVASKTETTQFAQVSWLEFLLEPVSIDTTKQYKITITTTSNTAYWVVSPVPCYAGGTAIIDTSPAEDQDFGFVTLGGNYEDEDVEPDPGSDIPAPTPSTIAKPTNVEAEFISPFDGVKVTWTASTTADITGYHIYRSESATTGYTKIGSVGKTVTEYLEQAEFEEETTYYYQVKAYKGDVLSAVSNTASVEIPVFEEETGEEEETVDMVDDLNTESTTKKWLNNIINYIIGGGIILTAIVVLVIILIIKKKKSKDTKSVKPEIKKEEIKTETTPIEPKVEETTEVTEEKKEE
ncbi:MAG: fibronectin type III domain-containing protein [Candidatus Dojkabacteria bacterium]|nr:fibronectin type III domain-containing protein [Candidatus Dojkabacteria bacterium]